jgi:hypothetical protein
VVNKVASVSGWLGLALIHGSTLPTIIGSLQSGTTPDLPASLVIMVWSGLALFLVNSIIRKDWLYMASNGIGFAAQSIMMLLVVIK